jgi:hypothetical protein
MAKSGTATQLRNLDHRVSTVEQIWPTLATKVDPERFATKEDLERFATKEDLERFATKEDLREESERSRRYMHMLYESLLDKINQILDVLQGHSRKLEEHGSRLDGHDSRIGAIDLRVTALEHPRKRTR